MFCINPFNSLQIPIVPTLYRHTKNFSIRFNQSYLIEHLLYSDATLSRIGTHLPSVRRLEKYDWWQICEHSHEKMGKSRFRGESLRPAKDQSDAWIYPKDYENEGDWGFGDFNWGIRNWVQFSRGSCIYRGKPEGNDKVWITKGHDTGDDHYEYIEWGIEKRGDVRRW